MASLRPTLGASDPQASSATADPQATTTGGTGGGAAAAEPPASSASPAETAPQEREGGREMRVTERRERERERDRDAPAARRAPAPQAVGAEGGGGHALRVWGGARMSRSTCRSARLPPPLMPALLPRGKCPLDGPSRNFRCVCVCVCGVGM